MTGFTYLDFDVLWDYFTTRSLDITCTPVARASVGQQIPVSGFGAIWCGNKDVRGVMLWRPGTGRLCALSQDPATGARSWQSYLLSPGDQRAR